MFLATTALSEFWDKDQEIVFLGSWCLDQERSQEWDSLTYTVLPCPWDDRERFYWAAQYVEGSYTRVLEYLAAYLNAIHGLSVDPRYWQVLIGPWLLHYIHALYDRYILLNDALAQYPEIQTIALDSQSFKVPKDASEFIDLVCTDSYNLQLFSQLLQQRGYAFPTKILQPLAEEPISKQAASPSWRSVPKGAALQALYFGGKLTERSLAWRWRIALCHMSLPRRTTWHLAWRSAFTAMPLEFKNERPFQVSEASWDHKRQGLADIVASDEFEEALVRSLPQNFPTLYLEGLPQARAATLRLQRRTPSMVASLVGWHFNEGFKFYAAEAAARGSRLLPIQHGGGYGVYRSAPMELFESRLGESFFVWGWADGPNPTLKNLPSPSLSLLSPTKNSSVTGTHHKVLYVGTAHPKYLYRFHSTPVGSQWEEYFQWQLRFLDALGERYCAMVRMRPYRYDYGHRIRERIGSRFPSLGWDRANPMSSELRTRRLIVVDNLGTTVLEALVADVPTIMFWQHDRWELRDEAQPYFDALAQAGVLWSTPEEAASKLVSVFGEPRRWWDSDQVQKARHDFVEHFALTRKDWPSQWARALKQEVELAYSGARA